MQSGLDDDLDIPLDTTPRGICQPKNCSVKLFPHQRVSVKQMEELERTREIISGKSVLKTSFGIQGDITGYGKTLSMVTLIMRNKYSKPCQDFDNYYATSRYFSFECKNTYNLENNINSTLVICSPTIVSQWDDTFAYFDDAKIYVVSSKKLIKSFKNPSDYHAIIVPTSFAKVFLNSENFFDKVWKRVIYDEPDSSPISGLPHIYAGFIWLISATYLNIFDVYRMRKSSFVYDMIIRMPSKCFNMVVIKNREAFVKKSYNIPAPILQTYHCQRALSINAVSDFVNPQIKEMLSAGDISGAIQALGGEDSKKNIMDVVLEHLHKKIVKYKINISNNSDSQILAVWRNKIVKCEEKIRNLQSRITDALNSECAITGETLINPVLTPCCQNIFSGHAIVEWLEQKDTCPMCRAELHIAILVPVYDGVQFVPENALRPVPLKMKTKQETLSDIIKSRSTSKFLIFSNHNETFNIIRRELDSINVEHSEIKGTSKSRQKIIQKFDDGDIQVLFLNSRSNCAGVNLQSATDIILYHELDERTYTQVVGRTVRVGSQTQTNIHQLTDS